MATITTFVQKWAGVSGTLPTLSTVGVFANMRGLETKFSLKERFELRRNVFAEMVIWLAPEPVRGNADGFKYRLALIEHGVCIVRYDNGAGKGDHKHIGDDEVDYAFSRIDALQADFWADIEPGPTSNGE